MNYGKNLKKWIIFVIGQVVKKKQTKIGLIYAALNNGLEIIVN
jgi:hypothetical protein